MCGIAGIFNADGKSVAIGTLRKMTEVIKHRGPDGEGYWTHGFVGLGHRRLAIIDLSPLGHQPMQNADGSVVIAYNGEVYNFNELRIELESKGYGFHSKSDTEVVLRAYEAWGEACVSRFNGMFAFAIWDGRRNRMFLARDRYGVKPLYYWFRDGTLLFGSEIKAILEHPDVEARVSLPALSEYFSFQNIFTDLTLFDGIRLLPAGCWLSMDLGSKSPPRQERYWDFHFADDESLDEKTCEEEIHRLFEQAVNRQMISDVEVGSYLSGGIDSGSITCLAARNFKNIKTFTCGFDLSSASGLELGFDERQSAEALSNIYKTEHYEVVLKAGDMERVMPKLIWHLEDLRVGQCYPNFYVARLASKFVKVSLSGAGGDELFAGYPWRYYRAAVNAHWDEYTDKYYAYWQRLIPDDIKAGFFRMELREAMASHSSREVFRSIIQREGDGIARPEEYINRSLYFEIKTFLHGLLEVEDKLSMAHGLETRVPFLDNDLVDFACRVPVRYKLRNLGNIVRPDENDPNKERFVQRNNDGKIILRQVLSRYVPRKYVDAVKQGFSAPDASWFKGESIDYIRDLLDANSARIYAYIDPDAARKMLNEHFAGQQNHRLLIWSMLCFEWWLRTFLTK